MSDFYSSYVVVFKDQLIGPYKTQAAATRIANKLGGDIAYTKPLLSWRESFAVRYLAKAEAE